ncbi:hypothetical protein ACNFJ7_02230 [Sphingomonas sp. HT-1]|uniref:hypothetical protein n=1 Tax=unclassified Sphingomonas TaxID=196159 RepID=UPI0002E8BF42|nr:MULTISPECIES: hypothetical protein [unclassified Sphingomonas]KTF70694.1 hypothetical protein ATB93_18755 [Sphingomonas sp. WG]
MFDITSQAVSETAAIHIKSATGEPLYADAERTKPVRIVIYGPASKAFAGLETRQATRSAARLKANDGDYVPVTAEERQRDTADDLTMITAGFENFTYGDGGMSGPELYRAVYADPRLGFITRQVVQSLGQWSAFAGKSAAA